MVKSKINTKPKIERKEYTKRGVGGKENNKNNNKRTNKQDTLPHPSPATQSRRAVLLLTATTAVEVIVLPPSVGSGTEATQQKARDFTESPQHTTPRFPLMPRTCRYHRCHAPVGPAQNACPLEGSRHLGLRRVAQPVEC